MEKKERGSFLKDCKKMKEENEHLRKVIKEIYLMAGMYYASMNDIRSKITQETGIDDATQRQ